MGFWGFRVLGFRVDPLISFPDVTPLAISQGPQAYPQMLGAEALNSKT